MKSFSLIFVVVIFTGRPSFFVGYMTNRYANSNNQSDLANIFGAMSIIYLHIHVALLTLFSNRVSDCLVLVNMVMVYTECSIS